MDTALRYALGNRRGPGSRGIRNPAPSKPVGPHSTTSNGPALTSRTCSVTSGALHPEIAVIAVPSTTDGGNMAGGDFDVTAGWGHFGSGQAVMPGQGRVEVRLYKSEEHEAMGGAISTLGGTTFDFYLNEPA